MTTPGATVAVQLGFMSASEAIPDDDHPGLLRAGRRASGPYGSDSVEFHMCPATDGCQGDAVSPDLFEVGFDTVDLSTVAGLQGVLGRIANAGHITGGDVSALRAALSGVSLVCSSSTTAEVLHIAEEGVIMRTAGPNGLSVAGLRADGMNGHSAATSIHADQDVYGTPLSQMMDGQAPSTFRHDSPDGYNHDATMMLVNLWIPLHQITQPLVLADNRSIDRRRHQLRHGLATSSFLEREDEMSVNDIWAFLHAPDQRWHLRSDMDHTSAYVFNTLSTPHGAGTLPGEDVAEHCYRALEDAESAVADGDVDALLPPLDRAVEVEIPGDTPPALRGAIAEMTAVAETARRAPADVCDRRSAVWSATSRAARSRVIRMSVELRLVISVDS